MLRTAMEFAVPEFWENRLIGSELMTPVERCDALQDFNMLNYLWVSIGGAIGTAARFWISGMIGQRYGEMFPYGTLIVNVTGSFVIGLFAALTNPDGRWLVSPS